MGESKNYCQLSTPMLVTAYEWIFYVITHVIVCFECLKFRLSLSVNGQISCVRLNCHSAVQKFSCLFYWKWPNGNLARHFKIKNIYIFQCQRLNGIEWLVYSRVAFQSFTLKLKRKRKLRDTECTRNLLSPKTFRPLRTQCTGYLFSLFYGDLE